MADTHIKINAVTPRVQYTGNGVTTTFPYEFAIFDETDMVVYVDDDIVESGYTVTGAGETEGGTVVFDTAPDDGIKITLLRDVPIERVTDFQEGGTFRPKNLNDEFDRQTAFVQQVQEILDRSVKVGPTSDVDPEEVLSQVERIYGSIDNVDAVADNLTSVYAVASDLTNIDAVASNQTNIDAVAGISSDVHTVASNASNVSNVATNMSDVNACATNIAAIQAAPSAASSAATSAQQAAISAAGTHFKLFQHEWFDYELNDMAWLRADTFSWQDGTVYSNAYNHLVADLVDATQSVETVGSYSLTVYTATDGHKIVLDDEESTVVNIFNESGVAWYYIVDTTNTRFKLPRTKYGFTGLRDAVGKYVEAGLPNITGTFSPVSDATDAYQSGCFYNAKTTTRYISSNTAINDATGFDASRSNSIYGNSTTVQPPATQMYLYFYVGQFSQSATEQTAGLNSEMFNSKQDVLPSTVDYVVESYRNGANWYRIYKSGWVEQGGQTTTGETTNLLKNFSHTDYTVEISLLETSSYPYAWRVYDRTVSNFKSAGDTGSNGKPSMWVAFGQGA